VSLKGEIFVPGDKSISHRSIMLGAIAEGVTQIDGFLMAEDCLSTINCFKKMGIEIHISDNPSPPRGNMSHTCKTEKYGKYLSNASSIKVTVIGKGLRGLKKPDDPLYVGNSGTTIRLLSGILAGQNFEAEITGDESIRKRPMGRVTEPLRLMGAKIEGIEGGNKAPLKIHGAQLKAIRYKLPVASAQVKSAILLAGLYANGETVIEEPQKSRDHTEIMLKAFGADIVWHDNVIRLNPVEKLTPRKISVPGDISSAAFFIAGACVLPGSEVLIKNVGINPTRSGIIEALRRMGADIQVTGMFERNGEPVADIHVKSSRLSGITVEGDIIPRLIDEIPVLAVAAAFAEGVTVIKNAEELRVKESNRIAAMVEGLSRLGARIKETGDGMEIFGPCRLRGNRVRSFGDHRVAMALAVAAAGAEGGTCIEDAGCVDISYPGFFDTLETLSR
jgi:3-phosphoshikimate 1-carboxyvinyltransferase